MKDQNTLNESSLKKILIGLAFILLWWIAGKPRLTIPNKSVMHEPLGHSLTGKDSIHDDQVSYYVRQYFESVPDSTRQGHYVKISHFGGLHLVSRIKVSPDDYASIRSFSVIDLDSVINIKKPLKFAQDDQTPVMPLQGKREIKRMIQLLKESPDSAYVEITAYDDFTMDTTADAFDVGLLRAGYFKNLFIQGDIPEESIELMSLNVDSLKRNSSHRIEGAIRIQLKKSSSPYQNELKKSKFTTSRYSRIWRQPGNQCLDFADQHLIIRDVFIGELGIHKDLMNLSYTLVFFDREMLLNELPRFNCEFINPLLSKENQVCEATVVNPISGNMRIKVYYEVKTSNQIQLKFAVYPISGDENSPSGAMKQVALTFSQNSQEAYLKFKQTNPILSCSNNNNPSDESSKFIRIEHASLRYDEIFLRVNNIKYFLHKEPGFVEIPYKINSKLELWECIGRHCDWITGETSFADDKYKIIDDDAYAAGHLKLVVER